MAQIFNWFICRLISFLILDDVIEYAPLPLTICLTPVYLMPLMGAETCSVSPWDRNFSSQSRADICFDGVKSAVAEALVTTHSHTCHCLSHCREPTLHGKQDRPVPLPWWSDKNYYSINARSPTTRRFNILRNEKDTVHKALGLHPEKGAGLPPSTRGAIGAGAELAAFFMKRSSAEK